MTVEEIIGYGVLNGAGNISDIGWSCAYIGMELKPYYYDCYYSTTTEMQALIVLIVHAKALFR